jgi:hypothetical protein
MLKKQRKCRKCSGTLPEERYFTCKKCQPVLEEDVDDWIFFDSCDIHTEDEKDE